MSGICRSFRAASWMQLHVVYTNGNLAGRMISTPLAHGLL
jgi:hypothetical protein